MTVKLFGCLVVEDMFLNVLCGWFMCPEKRIFEKKGKNTLLKKEYFGSIIFFFRYAGYCNQGKVPGYYKYVTWYGLFLTHLGGCLAKLK